MSLIIKGCSLHLSLYIYGFYTPIFSCYVNGEKCRRHESRNLMNWVQKILLSVKELPLDWVTVYLCLNEVFPFRTIELTFFNLNTFDIV